MQRKATNTVPLRLLFIVTCWNMCGVELRICSQSVAKDDRIVFPVDNDEPTNFYDYYIQINGNHSTTETPLNRTTLALDEMKSLNSTENSNTTTTTTTTTTISNTTELPIVDNRILIETLPICQPGYKLRAGRCRKSA